MRRYFGLLLIIAPPLSASAQAPATAKLTHNQFSDWFFNNNAGWKALGLNQLDKAEYYFRKAIDVARLELDADPRLLARSYGDLAWVLHREGRDSEAEPLARWALTVREKMFGVEKMPVAQTMYTLASIEVKLGQIEEAEMLLTRTLAVCRSNLGPDALGTGDAINDLATVYMMQRKYDKAQLLYSKALGIFAAAGVDHPGMIVPLDGLATIELAEGRLAEAEDHLGKVVAMIKRGSTLAPGFAARVLVRQAEVYRKTDRPEQAAKAEADAKALLEGPEPPARTSPNGPTGAVNAPKIPDRRSD